MKVDRGRWGERKGNCQKLDRFRMGKWNLYLRLGVNFYKLKVIFLNKREIVERYRSSQFGEDFEEREERWEAIENGKQ